MRKKMLAGMAIGVFATLAMAGTSSATVVTSLTGGLSLPMSGVNYFGGGPEVDPGFIWTSTNTIQQRGSVYGYTGVYGFIGNGLWDGSLGPMAGVNDSFDVYGVTDTMTFAFTSPVQSVGGFFNYVPGGSTPTTIAVYDTSQTLIESYNLTFLTGGGNDTGQFLGFVENTDNIGYLTLTDNYVAVTDLTVNGTASSVPEPDTMVLFGAGLVGLAGIARRKKNT